MGYPPRQVEVRFHRAVASAVNKEATLTVKKNTLRGQQEQLTLTKAIALIAPRTENLRGHGELTIVASRVANP
jgi:hypothetical protein